MGAFHMRTDPGREHQVNSATGLHPQHKCRVLALGIKPGASRWNDHPSAIGLSVPVTECRDSASHFGMPA